MGGHYDGHDISQARAATTAPARSSGLEAARALARYKGQIKRTIRVICFGAEEIGLLGAFHHAARPIRTATASCSTLTARGAARADRSR